MPMFKRGCIVLLVTLASACTNSSTAPTTTATATLSLLTVSCQTTTLTAVGQQTSCSATANFTNGTTQDETLSSQWSSSNASIASASATGVVTAVASGSVTITGTFQGFQGVRGIAVTLPANLTLTGTLTDGTSNGILPNLTVSIVSGTNSPRSTSTNSSGVYTFTGLAPGTFTLSVSAVSYLTTTQSVTLTTTNATINLVLQRTSSGGPAPAGTAPLTITIDPATCFGHVFVATVDVDGSYVGGLGNGQSLTVFVSVNTHVISAAAFPLTWAVTVAVPSNGLHETLTCP